MFGIPRMPPHDKTPKCIEEKMARIGAGGAPRVLDLFSGCGGMSLGFVAAGFESLGGVELDPAAAATYALNFHPEARALHDESRDITATEPTALLRRLGHHEPRAAVDVIVGGPPCPTFTRVGRAKLREVNAHPHAHLLDPRSELFRDYLRFVEALEPLAVVMENVPDFLNFGGRNVAEEVVEALASMRYDAWYTTLNAAHYGAPQYRERFVLVALRREVVPDSSFLFPAPSRQCQAPSGYHHARGVSLRLLDQLAQRATSSYRPAPPAAPDARLAVTVAEAIGDLPVLNGLAAQPLRSRGAQNLAARARYRERVPSEYGQQMREWRGFECGTEVTAHCIRAHGIRDTRLFAAMRGGDDYPVAARIARELWARECSERGVDPDDPRLVEARATFVPPYDDSKFPNKWRKLAWDEPSRTLMAHLGKDTYSHIHPDSDQARTISVREAARLQSFPDGFQFCGSMNAAFRQIGNAVPPLLAKALAEAVGGALGAQDARLGGGGTDARAAK